MLKHVYRAIILVFVFSGALFLFGRNIKEEKVTKNATVAMDQEKLPQMEIRSDAGYMNLMYGYSGNIDAVMIRDTITPLGSDQSLALLIKEKRMVVKKLKYELFDVDGNSLLESGNLSALKTTEEGKTAKIKLDTALVTGQEYALKITAISNISKKINYYTRVKVLSDTHLKEKMDFVMKFHDSILDKSKAEEVAMYLEPDYSRNNSNLASVDITSSLDAVSFAGLAPKVTQEIVPAIHEINEETASVELNYTMESKKASGTKEYYLVKEFYRVRYTPGRMYLLGYERTMESVFDMNLASVAKNELKFGVTQDKAPDAFVSEDETKVAFVRGRSLWYYESDKNRAVNVFSFHEDGKNGTADNYDQHSVKILDMKENGTLHFLVYGYMNRGDYEGRVAIVLYAFYPKENRIEEQVYIPLEESYQVLKEDLNQFSYVNQNQVFYFALNHVVYSYHIPTGHLETIVSGVKSDCFLMSREGRFIAWQEYQSLEDAKGITLLDLETGVKKTIEAPKGYNLRMLGSMQGNLIYGYGKAADRYLTTEGTELLPLSKVVIAGKTGSVLKEYEKKSAYVIGAKVKDNVIELERVKRQGTGAFVKLKADHILNNIATAEHGVGYSERVTDVAFRELYMTLPSGYKMASIPATSATTNTIITEDTTLRLKADTLTEAKYYTYSFGQIVGTFESVADAILLADERMGSVVDNRHRLLWVRGGKAVRNQITGVESRQGGTGAKGATACVEMLLSKEGIAISGEAKNASAPEIYRLLKKNLGAEPVNLSGCSLDEILYFISNNRPVIGMKDKNHPVLIMAYDEFNVTYLDPATGKEVKAGLNDGGKMFQEAGNIFISY